MRKADSLYELTQLKERERTVYTNEDLDIDEYPLLSEAYYGSGVSNFRLDDMLEFLWVVYEDEHSDNMKYDLSSPEEELYEEYERLYPELTEALLNLNFGSFRFVDDDLYDDDNEEDDDEYGYMYEYDEDED